MDQLFWAIELTVDFDGWRILTKQPDTEYERWRWIKMCHRLGSHSAHGIVAEQRMRVMLDTMS
jgi:hypothetical protein